MGLRFWERVPRLAFPATARPGSPEDEMGANLSLALTAVVYTWLVALILGVGFIFVRKFAPAVLILASLCAAGVSYYLARRSQRRLGAWILLAANWIVVTIAATLAGGPANIIPICYFVVIAGAGWLLGRRAAVLHVLISCAALAVLFVVDTAGPGLPRFFPVPPPAALLVFGGAVTVFAVPFLQMLESARRTREGLRESETRARARTSQLQAIMDAAPALILVAHDAECSCITGNRTAYTLLRQESGGNLSMAAKVGEHPTNHRLVRKGIEIPSDEVPLHRTARTGHPFRNYDLGVTFDDGVSIDLLGNVEPLVDENGRPQGAVAVLSDITERKRTEEALRESERQLASIYNTVRDAIFYLAVEPEGQFRFVSVNAAFQKITGLSREAVVGKLVNEIIPEPSLAIALGKYRQAVQENAVVSWEETSDYPTGRLTGEVSIAPVWDSKGSCTYLVGSVHDITNRKHAEAILRESEERFRTVADTAPVMIWMSGLDKLWTFVNKPWLDFRGRTMEQELGNGWADGMHPEDRDRCLATYSSSFDVRRNFQMEYRLRRADGEYRWILSNGIPRDRQGQFIGYIGSCVDITDQKLVEERLRSDEVRLKEAQRLARVGSWELDLETNTVCWSDAMAQIFGPGNDPPPDFQAMLSRTHPRDRERVLAVDARIRSSVGPVEVEHRIIQPNGDMRMARSVAQAIRNAQGAAVRIVGATQDITEQVKTTELLRESEERLRRAEHIAQLGHWDWDLKANRVSWSEEVYRILCVPQDYSSSFDAFLQMVPAQDRNRAEQWIRDCLAHKTGGSIEVQIVRPGGELRTLALRSELAFDEDRQPERMFGSCQDITDAKRAREESLSRQKLESLGTLASGIAHDFNNLLGAVLAQTELAIAELAAGSHSDQGLKAIRDVAGRGSEIVHQLMIYAGQEGDIRESVDIAGVVQGMLGLIKVAVSPHAALVTHLGEALPAVRARAAQISQIIMNLVVNASEAIGDRDGVIRLTAEHTVVSRGEAIVRALPDGEYVQLEVSDTGCGMSSETQAKIFDPFFTTKFSGRGLGLAVVQGIVRDLRGAIQVASEPNKGTTFQILLPCAQAEVKPDADRGLPIEESATPTRPAAILIVEDEELLRLAVTKMLRKSEFEVFEAASGSAAIDLLRARGGEIDLILLDLTIPGSSSQDVLAEAGLARPDLKVILTSAYSVEVAKPMMRAPLVCGFIRKPFHLSDLVRTIRNALSS